MTEEKEKKVPRKRKKVNFFIRMFLDNNDINEKSIVGFGAFIMMVLCLAIDILTGLSGDVLPINEFIFQGFLWITLGAFGIASIDKYISGKNNNKDEYEDDDLL